MTSLVDRLRPVLDQAIEAWDGRPGADRLRAALARMDEPLRVAIAGRVKAGKSTLLNALVGEELAPTDAGECTKIVTWYVDGHTYQVRLDPRDGEATTVPFRREDGALEIDLQGRDAAEVSRLVVTWPSSRLRDVSLIDTPGIASINADVSQRTVDFLTPADDRSTEADAVLYLLRLVHAEDVSFLEAFHDDELAQATPVNAVGVLARADEIGSCRLDALDSARRIAATWQHDRRLRRLVQTVVPVAGLLAQGGSTFTEDDLRVTRAIAAMEPPGRDDLLLSVDRVVARNDACTAVRAEREVLLDKLGLFGVRRAVQRVVDDPGITASTLAHELVADSGLDRLREVLTTQLAARADVLKARSAALVLESVIDHDPIDGAADLQAHLDEIIASAHEVAELRLLNQIRAGHVQFREDDLADAERLLGASGTTHAQRLDLPAGVDDDDLREAASEALGRWQRRAESPVASREARDGARVLVRTCEGILASLAPTPG